MVEILVEQKQHDGVRVVRALTANRRSVKDLTMRDSVNFDQDQVEQVTGGQDPHGALELDPATPRTLARRGKAGTLTRQTSASSVDSRPMPESAKPQRLYSTQAYRRQLADGSAL